MQPLMTVLLTLADGTSIVTEGIWENRFRYVDELIRMGANIQVDGQVAVIEGVKKLYPARCVRWICVPARQWSWSPLPRMVSAKLTRPHTLSVVTKTL